MNLFAKSVRFNKFQNQNTTDIPPGQHSLPRGSSPPIALRGDITIYAGHSVPAKLPVFSLEKEFTVKTHHVCLNIKAQANSAHRTFVRGDRRSDLRCSSRRSRSLKHRHRHPSLSTQLPRGPDRSICHRHGRRERGRDRVLRVTFPRCEWEHRFVPTSVFSIA